MGTARTWDEKVHRCFNTATVPSSVHPPLPRHRKKTFMFKPRNAVCEKMALKIREVDV